MTELLVLKRFWREIGMAILLALLGWQVTARRDAEASLRECQATRTIDRLTVSAATATAQANDTLHALAVERRDDGITQESERDLQSQLADARAAADAYAARLRDARAAADGGRGAAGVSAPSDPTGGVADANRASLLDADIRICSANTVKAAGWAAWWAKETAPAPAAADPDARSQEDRP